MLTLCYPKPVSVAHFPICRPLVHLHRNARLLTNPTLSSSTACSHIYYGEVGRTYEVQVLWPHRNPPDSTCNVTLVAAGGPHGDIVQVALRKFSIGKFNSHTDHGCPHGHMQIVENMRQYR